MPEIGCKCEVCTSADPRDNRLRASSLLHTDDAVILIDCGPDFREQMLRVASFGKIDGAFTLEILKVSAIPSDITALGAEGMKNIWHNAKLRGRGYSRANEIVSYAEKSVGLTDGTDAGREAVKWYAEQILRLDEQLAEIESALHEKCREIPYAENILAINGVGENILAGILAEMGDISRFDDVKEIQKLSGMGLVA